MYYGLHVPLFGDYAEPRVVAQRARDAEDAGWDGFFVWDHIAPPWHTIVGDPWITLSAIALVTERMRIGPLMTPLPRRRPWKVARETVALDHLSNGRLVLGVSLGGFPSEFDAFGEERDLAARAAMLDEGLAILTGLWSGQRFSYDGSYYSVQDAMFLPRPIQSPRIPIWVAATWPNKAPFRRAARWDGVFPTTKNPDFSRMKSPGMVAEILKFIEAHRTHDGPFDVVHGGVTPGVDPSQDRDIVAPYAEAGVTWWIESINPERWGGWSEWPSAQMLARIRQGPPRL